MRFNLSRSLLAATALFVGAACAPKMIPRTEIVDTPEAREMMDVLNKYKEGFEAKDAKAIAALASTRYLDARDSISYETLEKQLAGYFEKVKQVKIEITARRAAIEGDHARLDYIFAVNYVLNTNDPQWRSQTDDKRMTFEREGKTWKVTSGF
jgi:hypothetical protein